MTPRARLSLSHWIWLGLIAGIVCGMVAPRVASASAILAQTFVRLLQMLVVPLVVSSLLVGIGGRRDRSSLGRLLALTLVYFVIVTSVAGVMGLAAADGFQPGRVPTLAGAPHAAAPEPATSLAATFIDTLVPASAVQAMAVNNLLGIVFFTVLLSIGVAAVAPRAQAIVDLASAVSAAMIRVTAYVMWIAPIGVFGAAASSVGTFGLEGLRPFLKLLVVAYAALAVFAVLLFVVVSRLARFPLRPFLRALGAPLLLAFSTASGAAALPGAMEGLERWGASERVTSFVLPLGYSFNLAGTALYLPLVTVFWAQMQGVSLSWGQQAAILAYLLLVIRGLPSVPRALFLVWGAALAQFHLPPEGVVVLLGIDPLIDMARTVVNVAGNCLAVAAIDRWQEPAAVRDAGAAI